jgi:hypothetical protein
VGGSIQLQLILIDFRGDSQPGGAVREDGVGHRVFPFLWLGDTRECANAHFAVAAGSGSTIPEGRALLVLGRPLHNILDPEEKGESKSVINH